MSPTAPPQLQIGHVHLMVSDLERSIRFYTDLLGLELVGRVGDQIAFLSNGEYHHLIALNTLQSEGGTPPPAGSTGLFHVAVLYPTRAALAAAVEAILESGVSIDGGREHGVSQAVYVRDPDLIGIELCWDRPPERWPRGEDGTLLLINESLDLEDLMAARAGERSVH